MKCIKCGTDNKLKDRTANFGRCSRCSHTFAFEPTSMGSIKITDPMFAKMINNISVADTLFFTPKQMFYYVDNRLRSKGFNSNFFALGFILIHVILFLVFRKIPFIIILYQIFETIRLYKNTKSPKLDNASRKASAKYLRFVGGFILLVGIAASVLIYNSFLIFVVATLLGMTAIYLGITQVNKTAIPSEFIVPESTLQEWLNRWQQINGNILKLLPNPQPKNQFSAINPDVTAYSFDRLIVCDSDEIAQFLIANNFHFENNCAILSITGYPHSIFQITMEMLRRNPDLKVYALHSCTADGLSLVHRLKTSPDWFQNSNVTIIDIGISPRHVLATKKGIFIEKSPQSATDAKQLIPEIRQELSPEELQWLEAGNIVKLESFQPQKLIQIIQRRIANTGTIDSSGSDLIIIGSEDNFTYTTENFG
ncbi:hypothetical protein G7B40_027840 [Aetokthonos hydrillicola Thurmond2011]|jgi:hypothetical protein|uniref:Uncharacterized protein n=2 Tax=Aetokthonos TaxID=1550243 RepID=A0AAP5IBA4_9CYAN|nr:hypothetical protein [Aetokthonos hydrillicola]MBO3459164.1 hypothetical protein [Aetokthonos hydrillicola CCALA 1050]MBW4584123.1 hypothetical protein [Aetokthonos hydrillicola CCALA 1050]MDR9898343.1 hypothetical protein [Aetokthonos hydrillicola Thurmond2011]